MMSYAPGPIISVTPVSGVQSDDAGQVQMPSKVHYSSVPTARDPRLCTTVSEFKTAMKNSRFNCQTRNGAALTN